MRGQLCGVTAFRLYRTPPLVLALMPAFPDLDIRAERCHLPGNPWATELLGLPFHTLIDSPRLCHGSSSLKPHLWSKELPPGSFLDFDDLGITCSSPLFTLLTLAPHISLVHLAMIMYEMCGTFSIFNPSKFMQQQIDAARSRRLADFGGWRQVHDTQGRATSLWKRDPLLELSEIQAYAATIKGLRGSGPFASAAKMVTGITASPLEVQTSMRLALSRRAGGEGLDGFTNNKRIALPYEARIIADQHVCYADIYFEGDGHRRPLDIECHGHMVHDGGTKEGLDANRMLALQKMGIDVMLLTSEQVRQRDRFRAVVNHLEDQLDIKHREKSRFLREQEDKLCRELFVDWTTLGT